MANRNYNRYQALEKEIKALYMEVDIAAAGVPTALKKLGITSIDRSGAGAYDVVLDDKYTRLMSFSVIQLDSSNQDLTFQLTAQDVKNKTLSFVCKTAAASTDPADGSKLYIKVELKNSSVGE